MSGPTREEQSMVTNGPYRLNLMDGARHYFLAGTSFAQQQDRPAAASQLVHHPQDISDARRLANQ